MRYNYNDIKESFKNLGISKGMTISLKSDLQLLGPYDHKNQSESLAAHFNALADLIDLSEGTIVVATSSLSLCNSDTVFDIDHTPSEVGVLTEYVRTWPDTVRSFHPFSSYAAIGKNANYICNNTSRHAYGAATPKERLLELDATYLSLGKPPQEITTFIHHIEMLMGVPYRYVKEFIHPVLRDGNVVEEPFYMHLRYNECNAVRNLGQQIFPYFYKSGYEVKAADLGRGKVYSYSVKEFYSSTVQLMSNDLYAFLESEPIVKPYRK
jgi:aminoglycoside 3-N-acetyltransferase